MSSRAQLEKRYGIKIVDDSYFNYLGRWVKAYKYYSADGCPFSNNLKSIKAVEKDCKYWGDRLLHIKKTVESYKDV